jgi:hypothetical protein
MLLVRQGVDVIDSLTNGCFAAFCSLQCYIIAYLAGRIDKDPSLDWYNTVLLLFDDYVVPLAIRLRESGILGVEGDELVHNAVENRRAWSRLGREMVKDMMTHYEFATKNRKSSHSKSNATLHEGGGTTSLVPSGESHSSKYRFKLDDEETELKPRSPQKHRKTASKKRRPPLS